MSPDAKVNELWKIITGNDNYDDTFIKTLLEITIEFKRETKEKERI